LLTCLGKSSFNYRVKKTLTDVIHNPMIGLAIDKYKRISILFSYLLDTVLFLSDSHTIPGIIFKKDKNEWSLLLMICNDRTGIQFQSWSSLLNTPSIWFYNHLLHISHILKKAVINVYIVCITTVLLNYPLCMFITKGVDDIL
jgi:hypothetical protein